MCQETVGGRPVCSCPSGHSGNPLTYCRRAECLDHAECRGDMACRSGSCVNPCAGTCGSNANCEVIDLLNIAFFVRCNKKITFLGEKSCGSL